MRDTRYEIRNKGAALLIVLFIVMAITILSLGFLARSDVELACGRNMILRTQMDYLAESGLEHARGLILNPQDVASECWTGATTQQLVAGSDDYYDVDVVKVGQCNYQITSRAYREKDGEQVGRSILKAELRLDPCITYWVRTSTTISGRVTINGDVYCGGDLTNNGTIAGDVFASGNITGGGIEGQENEEVGQPPVDWPGLNVSNFSSHYYIGSTQYSVDSIATEDLNDVTLGLTAGNPAGIYYRNGNLNLFGDVHITGMLVVKDDLKIEQGGNVIITATKNFPALLVGGNLKVERDNVALRVTGLSQIGHFIDVKNKQDVTINFTGALYIWGDGIKNASPNSDTIIITAAPDKAAIEIWPTPGNASRWSPAAGAFFKSIQRQ